MVDGRKEGAQWARDIILTVIFLPALLSWLGMTAPQIIIISICALALLKAWEHGRLGTTIVAIAIVGAGIGWDWFYYSTMTAAPQVTSPAQPSTAPQSPIGKIKPTPWVTQQEIDDQQKFGKILLTYSPKELLELWGRGGNIGAYLNKWIKIDYPFPDNGLTVETVDKKEFDTVKITLSFGFISSGLSAYFDRKKWDAKLVLLRPKDDLKAICRFNRIDRSEPTKGWLLDTLIASDCDLF